MRLLVIWSAVAILAAGICDAALAKIPVLSRTQGAESLVLTNGNGRAVVTRRGALLVDMRRGRLRIVDLPGPGHPILSRECRRRADRVRGAMEIRGRNVGCLISSGGRWQVIMQGRGISANGIVRGSVTLDAADHLPLGTFKRGDRPRRPWPTRVRTYGLSR
jgi:hypothetical protein